MDSSKWSPTEARDVLVVHAEMSQEVKSGFANLRRSALKKYFQELKVRFEQKYPGYPQRTVEVSCRIKGG